MIEKFRRLMNFWRYLGLILGNKAGLSKKDQRSLFFGYLYLKLIGPQIQQSGKINQLSFLGHKLHYFDLLTTVSLIEAIFIENEYYFQSEKENPRIIDLGSNIGLSIIYHKLIHQNSQIDCFEPDPESFKVLRKNVRSFGLKQVRLHNEAVSNKTGKIKFYVDKSGPGSPLMSTKKQRLPKNQISVRATKLSRFIKNKIDFLKMDIEGSEDEVIEDLNQNTKLLLIEQMSIEYHHHIYPNQDKLSAFLGVLEKNNFGYQIHASQNTPFVLSSFEDIQIHAYKK